MSKRILILLFIVIMQIFCIQKAFAYEPSQLNIVYPNKTELITNTKSYFFVGSISPNSSLTINDKPVKLSSNGAFVEVVNINAGQNKFVFKSLSPNNDIIQKTYTINTTEPPKPISGTPVKIVHSSIKPTDKMILKEGDTIKIRFQGSPNCVATYSIGPNINLALKELSPAQSNIGGIYTGEYTIKKNDNFKNEKINLNIAGANLELAQASYADISTLKNYISGEVITDNAVVRDAPDQNRLTPLPKGTKVTISGQKGDYYRIELTPSLNVWMQTKDIQQLGSVSSRISSAIKDINIEENENFLNLKLKIENNIPLQIIQNPDNSVTLNLYGGKIKLNQDNCWLIKRYFSDITFDESDCSILKITILPKFKHLWGFDYYYENGNLVMSFRKPPCINIQNPLQGQTIAIDPGHGGTEAGAIGPTGVPEKTINLGISMYLKQLLEESGAKVIMTRTRDDETVEIYSRPEIAKKNNAIVLISIHNNSLPDGQDPYKTHGTTSYYYQPQSEILAKTLQAQMVYELGFPDQGTLKGSFVLTRPTLPLATLLEVGFMIYPDEYNLLITPDFQQKAAISIRNGLEKFFLESAEK